MSGAKIIQGMREALEATDLLPCPFCGMQGCRLSNGMSMSKVYCPDCRSEGPHVWHGGPNAGRETLNRCEAAAAYAWNTRSPTPSDKEQTE